jgi:hypothetical protein
MRTIMIAGLFLLASVPLLAAMSGLTWIPSTDTQASKTWHLNSYSYIYTNGGQSAPLVDDGVLYGLNSRIELGADVDSGFANASGEVTNPLLFNAKYQFITPSAKVPVAVAAGACNVSPQTAANAEMLYGVASYQFNKGLSRVTAGGYSVRKSVAGVDNTGYMVGAEDNIGKWWLTADFQSGENTYGAVNGGVGYNLTPKVLLFVGYDHYNNPTVVGAKSSVNFQVGITL